jgi:hypothetical protein
MATDYILTQLKETQDRLNNVEKILQNVLDDLYKKDDTSKDTER